MGKKTVLIVLQVLFAAGVLALAYWLYVIISTPIKFENEQKIREAAVISRIKDIRSAERVFKSKYQRFTADFDSLINFVLTETMEGERKKIDEDDSVAMAQAKKKYGKKFQNIEKFTFSVKDSLFKHLTAEQVKELRYVPYKNDIFMGAMPGTQYGPVSTVPITVDFTDLTALPVNDAVRSVKSTVIGTVETGPYCVPGMAPIKISFL